MNKRAYLFVVCIAVAAVVIITAGVPLRQTEQLTLHDLLGVLAFVCLYILSDALAITFVIGSKNTAISSLTFIPLLACCIVFPPAVAVLATAAAELITQLSFRSRAPWIVSFNVSQTVISVHLATTAAIAIGSAGEDGIQLSAFVVLVLVFFFVNTALIGYLFVLRQKSNLLAIVRSIIGSSGGNLFYSLLASPVAVFAAFLYNQMYIGGLVLMVLPLLLIRYSYLSKIQLEHANQDLLRVLVKTIETRDPYTSGHSLRVSKIARAIAEDLGFSRRKVEQVETAALLHDVGKTDAIYASIIRKPTALTPEETEIIRTHAMKGAQMLEGLSSFPEEVIRGVRHHHERYDGRGYPDGLSGKAIPLAARIIMLCDSIDAMLSDRPYRPALTVDQVADEVRRCAGSQFDPEIADAIVRLDTINRVAAMIQEDATAARTPEPAGSL